MRPSWKSPEDEDVEKGRDVGLADAGRLFETHRFGDGHQVIGIGHGVFGVAPSTDEGHDPVARLPVADPGAGFLDDPGHLQAEDFRISRRRRILALPLHKVGTVDGSGGDLDKNLIFLRLRFFRLTHLENVETAESIEQHSFHEALPPWKDFRDFDSK